MTALQPLRDCPDGTLPPSPPPPPPPQFFATPFPGVTLKVGMSIAVELPYQFQSAGAVNFTLTLKFKDLHVELRLKDGTPSVGFGSGDWTGTGIDLTDGHFRAGSKVGAVVKASMSVGICLFMNCVDLKASAVMESMAGFDLFSKSGDACVARADTMAFDPWLTHSVDYTANQVPGALWWRSCALLCGFGHRGNQCSSRSTERTRWLLRLTTA